jgi:disulfide bond formation protein DsbB
MPSLITQIFTVLTVLSHVVFLFIIAALIFRIAWGKEIIAFISKWATSLSLLVAALGVSGSLLYSNLVGFEPCELCWWQRIFLFPQAVIFLIAVIKKDVKAFWYAAPLSVLGGIVALYHTYIQLGGESSVLPCTSAGGACAKVYVLEQGYITIPTMALTVFLYILLFALIHRVREKVQ